MTATKTHLSVNLARICLPLLNDARRSYIIAHPSINPTDAAVIGYSVYLIKQFKRQGGDILWHSLLALDPDRLNLPPNFPHDIRFRLGVPRSIIPLLDRFCESELRPVFEGKIYRNLVIRAILTAAYCLTHDGFKDVLIVAGDSVPAESPAAYDPYGLMFPYRSDPRNSEGIDPSIFDFDDMFPNGKVDAEGFADDSADSELF